MSAVPRFTPPIALMDPGHPQYSHFPSSRLGIDEEDEHEEVGTHASSSSHLTTDPSHITSSLVDSENRSSQGLRSSDDGTSHQVKAKVVRSSDPDTVKKDLMMMCQSHPNLSL